MKRILKGLGAFAMMLALSLSLAAVPFASAAEAAVEGSYAGYLVMLVPRDQVAAPADMMGQATLMASYDEREELLALAEDAGIYKANDLSDIENLVWSGQVQVAEPDYEAELFDADPTAPNDPYFNTIYQYNLMDADCYGVSVRAAWEAGLTGEGITVAVVDTGINDSHEDVPTKVARGRYYFYREEEGGRYSFTINGVTRYYNYYSSDYVTDDVGHGSMVSGIIASPKDNGKDIAGMAPNVTILPVRCFTNTKGHLGGYTSNLISGVTYAMENGADIINMSWGITGNSTALKTVIDRAHNAGCILFAAVGNGGPGTTYQYPAAYDNVIGVGATNKAGTLWANSQRNDSVALCAPGTDIYSLGLSSANAISRGSGTSFSTPMVAAAAALLKEAHPNMTQADFYHLLEQSCDAIAGPYTGLGRLNIERLLDVAGCAGASVASSAGTVTFRAAYHPEQDETTALDPNVMLLLGAYNAQGHLLDSKVIQAGLGKYGAYTGACQFQAPEAVVYRAFYLKNDASLAALIDPVAVDAR